jgi:hypothetical protein
MAWIEGERTSVLASLLRLSHLSETEQRAEVKRFKDRLKRRFLRVGTDRNKNSTAEVEFRTLAGNYRVELTERDLTSRVDSARRSRSEASVKDTSSTSHLGTGGAER